MGVEKHSRPKREKSKKFLRLTDELTNGDGENALRLEHGQSSLVGKNPKYGNQGLGSAEDQIKSLGFNPSVLRW